MRRVSDCWRPAALAGAGGERPVVRWRRRAAARPRTILLGVIVASGVALGLYAAAPWLLPVRIYEGPMVQMATANAVSLVWYTTRPADCAVVVLTAGAERVIPATATGTRHLARVDGLEPGTTYTYQIRVVHRPLTDKLAFHTNRAAGQRFSFLVFGDSGRATRAQYGLVADMLTVEPQPDFILHTGDVVYSDGARKRYHDRFFAPYRSLLTRVNFWPSVGNHDVARQDSGEPVGGTRDSALAYQEVFELPQNGPAGLPPDFNYTFDYASCRVAVVDTNADNDTLRDRIAPWLREVLSAPGPRWKFVVYHHATYTAGKYKHDLRPRQFLVPVLDATGVDVVFNGHDHNYQRTLPLRGDQVVPPGQGTVYIITGAGGAQLYDVPAEGRPPYVAFVDDREHSFTHVNVDGDTLTLRQVALGGKTVDTFTWRKPPTSQPAAVTSAPADSPAAVTSPDSAPAAP